MKLVSDIDPMEWWKVLLFGAPGAGKTWLAGTFPSPAFVDTDGGMRTLASKPFMEKYPGQQIFYESFDDPTDEYGAFTQATGFWKAMDFANKLVEEENVKTIVFDSLSSLQVLGMHVGMELSGQHRKSQTMAKMEAARKGKGIPVAIPTQADYGSEMAVFEQFMDKAITIPKHVIFIAHERDVTGDSGALLRRDPLLVGQAIRAKIAKWFDEVWYLDIGPQQKRVLHTQSTATLKAVKSRSGLPAKIENPDFVTIASAVEEQWQTKS